MTTNEKHQILAKLATSAIMRLRELPVPVVRVFGPLTSGGYGYNENLRRFIFAQERLRAEGKNVFDYFQDNDDEESIKKLELPWEDVMEHYHKPIMATNLITTLYMMPRWQESNGARWEHEYAEELGLEIKAIPEDWFG